jgi:UDP-N-acetylglucosamine diphosphorylase/glucosamine-1-phosphate N-acetyltransferase
VGDLLCGSMTMRQRWEMHLNTNMHVLTADHLQAMYSSHDMDTQKGLYINARYFPTSALLNALDQLSEDEQIWYNDELIAAWADASMPLNELYAQVDAHKVHMTEGVERIDRIWNLFQKNAQWIAHDWQHFYAHRVQSVHQWPHVIITNPQNVYIGNGVTIGAGTVINSDKGPVIIEDGAEIMEQCAIRGPFVLKAHSVLKMSTKMYDGSTIGEGCKVGGELSNVIFFPNSNKGHDGYLGNAIIGSWCNLGADTNCSNLKNNYDIVKIWDEAKRKSVSTGTQFCGLIMGDHSKCGINTMFNTGTVVGVSCNVFGEGFPPKYIPSFSWGGAQGFTTYQITKAIETAERMMARRQVSFTDVDKRIFDHIFNLSEADRTLFSSH